MPEVNPRFKLKEPKATKRTLIVLKVYYKKERFTYSTGELIHPDYWGDTDKNESHRIIYPRSGPDNKSICTKLKDIDSQLDRYKSHVKKVYRDFEKDRVIPTTEQIRIEMDKEFKIQSQIDRQTLISFGEQLIKESKEGKRLTRNGKHISTVTIKGYQTTVNHLTTFAGPRAGILDLDKIGMNFYKSFVKYFHDDQLSTNTVGKNIKNVKVFIKEAYKRGLTDNRIFENEEFRITEEETDKIYLNESEIEKIFNLNLSENPKLDRVRDAFIFECRTGIRFGDLKWITQENFNLSANTVKVKTQKTGETVIIPLHWMVTKVLEKYEGRLPRIITNQKMNEYLKVLGKKAGIIQPIKVSITKGGLRVESTRKKYQLITTHTGRRSFATNAFLAGIPTISIMKITSHRTERSFMKYIRISQEDNANALMDHPYFKQQADLKIV